MAAKELTCQELVELVTEYFEGALPSIERVRFEAHLAECEGCATYLEQMKQTIWVVGQLTERDVSPPARAALLEIFHGWKK
jgi:predicted anti-sigma-YlaC factor YlaD